MGRMDGHVYAAFNGNKYGINIAKFGCWVLFFITLMMLPVFYGEHKNRASFRKKVAEGVNPTFDLVFDLAITIAFAAMGWFWYATLYLCHMLISATMKKDAQKEMENAKTIV